MIGDVVLSFPWAIARANLVARETGLRQRVRRCSCLVIESPHFTIRAADTPEAL